MFMLEGEEATTPHKVTLHRARTRRGEIDLCVDGKLIAWLTPEGELWVYCHMEDHGVRPGNFTIHRWDGGEHVETN